MDWSHVWKESQHWMRVACLVGIVILILFWLRSSDDDSSASPCARLWTENSRTATRDYWSPEQNRANYIRLCENGEFNSVRVP